MSELIETIAIQLQRPRELPAKVTDYIGGTYGVDEDDIGAFLTVELPTLEDDEVDLILSPLFTPKLADQAIFAGLLGAGAIPRNGWPELVRQLVERPTRGQFVTTDGRTHAVNLRAVTVERYVHRLCLDSAVPEAVSALIARTPDEGRAMLLAVARRYVWEDSGRRAILERYLASALEQNAYSLDDAMALLDLAESYKPPDVAGLMAKMPRWQQALREQVHNAPYGGKPFFSDQIAGMHGGVRDQRLLEEAVLAAKKNELAFLQRLERILTGE